MIANHTNTPEVLNYLIKQNEELKKMYKSISTNVKPEIEKFITSQQVADFLDCTVQSVYTRTRAGDIPHYKESKRVLYLLSEVIEAIKQTRTKTNYEIYKEVHG